MAGQINISGNLVQGNSNEKPFILDFKQSGEAGSDSFVVKYTAKDNNNQILKHYLLLNGEKTDISKAVDCTNINREFTYTVTGLKGGTTYNVQIEVSDGLDVAKSQVLKISTANYKIYGVSVDTSNSNPANAVTYIEDAIGVTPAKNGNLNGWADKWPFNEVRLVGFKAGKVTKEVNPTNKTKYKDGTTIPADVDVMSEIPKIYWKVTTSGNKYEIRICNQKLDSGYKCLAHLAGGVEKDFIYIGAYLGYVENGKLRSKSGVNPTASTTLTNFRSYARAVGSGYQLDNWHPLTLRKILYLIAYKNLDSQTALGKGNTGSGSKKNTGGTNTRGLYYGSTNVAEQVCFLGIEDFYGNLYTWVDGMYYNGNIMVTPDNKTFNDSASGFKNVGSTPNLSTYGYVKNVVKTAEGLFFPSDLGGSTSTYYSDSGNVASGCFSVHGGSYYGGDNAGAFYLHVRYRASESVSGIGGRLVYMG